MVNHQHHWDHLLVLPPSCYEFELTVKSWGWNILCHNRKPAQIRQTLPSHLKGQIIILKMSKLFVENLLLHWFFFSSYLKYLKQKDWRSKILQYNGTWHAIGWRLNTNQFRSDLNFSWCWLAGPSGTEIRNTADVSLLIHFTLLNISY